MLPRWSGYDERKNQVQIDYRGPYHPATIVTNILQARTEQLPPFRR